MNPEDVEMKAEPENGADPLAQEKPAWMKSKLAGVKKVSNKERRRRQNETLRRLLSPKNALMVLNEMMPKEQLNNQFRVESSGSFAGNVPQFYGRPQPNFCADLTLDGSSYKGYGDNKLTARNAAAEQAIRDLMIRKMSKVLSNDASSAGGGSQNGDEPAEDEETLPMIQLASFALHKLFSEWEFEGHKVPQLKANPNAPQDGEASSISSNAGAEKKQPPKPKVKTLPLNAARMHPCMLLTYMRPALAYRTLGQDGNTPQTVMFTMGVDVDNTTYIGKATNKKEARRLAAKSACQALFNVQFEDNATANTPITAT